MTFDCPCAECQALYPSPPPAMIWFKCECEECTALRRVEELLQENRSLRDELEITNKALRLAEARIKAVRKAIE